MTALTATVGKGDEVLIPNSCWPYYLMQLNCCRATAVPYSLNIQQDGLPLVEELEKLITPRTRMLIINSPGNPTGVVFPRYCVAELVGFALRHNLYLLSDECYDQIVFDEQHTSPAIFLSKDEFETGQIISVCSFSKTYAMTGWRIGYLVTGLQLIKTINYVLEANYTNVSTIVQRAAAAALTGPQTCVVNWVKCGSPAILMKLARLGRNGTMRGEITHQNDLRLEVPPCSHLPFSLFPLG